MSNNNWNTWNNNTNGAAPPPPPMPPHPPKRKMGALAKAGIIVGSAFVGLLALGAVGSALGGGTSGPDKTDIAESAGARDEAQASKDAKANEDKAAKEKAAKEAAARAAAERTTERAAKPQTISGHGTGKSEKIHLDGDYTVKVTWSDNAVYGSASNIILNLTGDGVFDSEILMNEISASGSDTSHVYDLDGDYYIDPTAQGDWSVTFTPA